MKRALIAVVLTVGLFPAVAQAQAPHAGDASQLKVQREAWRVLHFTVRYTPEFLDGTVTGCMHNPQHPWRCHLQVLLSDRTCELVASISREVNLNLRTGKVTRTRNYTTKRLRMIGCAEPVTVEVTPSA